MKLTALSKYHVDLVSKFPNELTGKVVKLSLAALQPQPQDLTKPIDKFSKDKQIPPETLREVLSIYILILRQFIRTTDKEFIVDMIETGFSNEFIDQLPFLHNRKELVSGYFSPYYDSFQNLDSFKWRIDISLLNSLLEKKSFPTVVIRIKLKSNKSYTVELNSRSFHLFRFNVALILKEMKALTSLGNK